MCCSGLYEGTEVRGPEGLGGVTVCRTYIGLVRVYTN
jgi:hypothetical protein